MSETVVKIENLSKKYIIGHQSTERYPTFREALSTRLKLWGRLFDPSRTAAKQRPAKREQEEFYALKDVSLEIRRGDRVGIIGRNGAGKSTLLKLLSRITEPTTGKIEIEGRVASLLEVGTGFHPELTGRENIFLNGAILGMAREEIRRKFDEIVAFSEIERFLDTPVKRYSSGMYVRLAFAVAAHLEPEILIVDEVLAVGDAQFQKKCLGKIEAVGHEGRTVLFVSHNMATITKLCSRCVMLQAGQVVMDGNAQAVVNAYYDSFAVRQYGQLDLRDCPDRYGRGDYARLISLAFLNRRNQPVETIPMGAAVTIRLEVEFSRPVREPEVGVVISTLSLQRVVRFVSVWEGLHRDVEPGVYQYDVTVPELPLVPGGYTLTPWVKHQRHESDDLVESALCFNIVEANINGHLPYFDLYCQPGEVYLKSSWQVHRL